MTTDGESGRWLVLVVRVPAEPSRHRVAVWRELRRAGAVPLGPARPKPPFSSSTAPNG